MRRHHQPSDIPCPHSWRIPRRYKVHKLDVSPWRVFGKLVRIDGPIGDVVGEEVLEMVEDAGRVVGAGWTRDQDWGEEGAVSGGEVVGEGKWKRGFEDGGLVVCQGRVREDGGEEEEEREEEGCYWGYPSELHPVRRINLQSAKISAL